jgi:hypothetical protein
MNREEIYALIDKERAEQDKVWSNREQYSRSAPHILVLDGQLTKLKAEWYAAEKDAVTSRLVKMAAIAVRALEEVNPDLPPTKIPVYRAG